MACRKVLAMAFVLLAAVTEGAVAPPYDPAPKKGEVLRGRSASRALDNIVKTVTVVIQEDVGDKEVIRIRRLHDAEMEFEAGTVRKVVYEEGEILLYLTAGRVRVIGVVSPDEPLRVRLHDEGREAFGERVMTREVIIPVLPGKHLSVKRLRGKKKP